MALIRSSPCPGPNPGAAAGSRVSDDSAELVEEDVVGDVVAEYVLLESGVKVGGASVVASDRDEADWVSGTEEEGRSSDEIVVATLVPRKDADPQPYWEKPPSNVLT